MAYDINELVISNDEINKRIANGIEENRKGNFSIRTKAGSTVSVRLKNHKFRFGCNMFMLDEIPDDLQKTRRIKKN